MSGWLDIARAPRDGTPIQIKGLRFMTEEPYTATAIWTTRNFPSHPCEGWFPPTDKHDGMGPYEDVRKWRPLKSESRA